jgi:hypothetical protein
MILPSHSDNFSELCSVMCQIRVSAQFSVHSKGRSNAFDLHWSAQGVSQSPQDLNLYYNFEYILLIFAKKVFSYCLIA